MADLNEPYFIQIITWSF